MRPAPVPWPGPARCWPPVPSPGVWPRGPQGTAPPWPDRKSTRLNSSHLVISYAVFCLKKKKNNDITSSTYSSKIGHLLRVAIVDSKMLFLHNLMLEYYHALSDLGSCVKASVYKFRDR